MFRWIPLPCGQESSATDWLILVELLLPCSAGGTSPFFREILKWSVWIDFVSLVSHRWLIDIPADITFKFGHHFEHLLF
jgi:hypothetical protein